MRRLLVLMTAAFLLFSVIGFNVDSMSGGVMPYSIALLYAVLAGLNAAVWVLVLARLPMFCLLLLIGFEFFNSQLNRLLASWFEDAFHPAPLDAVTGLHFTATSTLVVVIAS